MPEFTVNELVAASHNLKGYLTVTPVIHSDSLRTKCNKQGVYLKCENLQRSGSYHIRGMLHKVISTKEKDLAVNNFIIHSAGNSGSALALASHLYQSHARVVVPKTVNESILRSIKHYKGEYYLCEPDPEARDAEIKKIFNELNYTKDKLTNTFQVCEIVRPYRDRSLVLGYATLGLEFLNQMKNNLDCIIVPVAGGMLLAGVAMAVKLLKPSCAVYGADVVHKDNINFHNGFYDQIAHGKNKSNGNANEKDDKITSSDKNFTDFKRGKLKSDNEETCQQASGPSVRELVKRDKVADAIVSPISPVATEYINAYCDGILHVDEEQLRQGCRYAFERLKLVVDVHAATVISALLVYAAETNVLSGVGNSVRSNNKGYKRYNKSISLDRYQNIGLVLSGGNIDLKIVPEITNAKL